MPSQIVTAEEFFGTKAKKDTVVSAEDFFASGGRKFKAQEQPPPEPIPGSLVGDFISGMGKSFEKGFTKPVLEPAISTLKSLVAFPFGVGTHIGGRLRGETPEEATQVSEAWRQKIMDIGPPPSDEGIGKVVNAPFEAVGKLRNRMSEDISKATGIAKEDVGTALDAALLLSPKAKSLLKNMRADLITPNDLVPIFKEAAEMKPEWDVPAKATATIKRVAAKLPKVSKGVKAETIIPTEVFEGKPAVEIVETKPPITVAKPVREYLAGKPTPKPSIKIGQKVLLPNGKAAEVIDISDPSLLGVKSSEGTNFKIGRGVVKPAEMPPSSLKQAVDESFNKTAAEIQGAKQGGFIKIAPSVTKGKIESPKVNAVLDKSVLPRQIIGRLKFKLNEKVEAFKDVFVYEHKIADQPAFQNEIRKFQGTPGDAREFSGKTLVATVGKLTKDEFDTFEKYVGLKSMEGEVTAGRKVSGELTVPDITTALADLQPHVTPNVQAAINNHVKFTTLAGDELIARGKLDPEMRKDFYFHHRVLDYNPPWTNNKSIPKRFQKPFRDYVQARKGTAKALDFDYISAMSDFYEKMFLDNALDDFHVNTISKYDILPTLSPNQRAAALGAPNANPKPGLIYDIKGKRYKGFQYDKGNYFYRGEAVNENLIQKAIDEGWTVEEFTASEGPRGGAALREGLMVGKKKPVSLLPESIAGRLERFSSPTGQAPPFYFEVRNMTALWKRLVLDFAGIPFQVGNAIGDFMNGLREDPGLVTKIPEAAKLSFKETYRPGKLTPKDLSFLEKAKQQRISGGYMTSEANLLPGAPGALQRFKDYRNPLTWPDRGLKNYELLSSAREKTLRYAKAMKDFERIEGGGAPVTRTFGKEIAGLAPEEAAGKLNRMTFIDYDAISPQYKRYLRGRNFPFLTFYDQNMRGWAKAIARDPKNVMLKFVIPSAAVFAWNNTGDRKEIEQNLGFRRYQPHVITGTKDKNGKDIVLALQTPLDMAMSWFGLDRLPAKITDVRAGKMTIGQAAVTQLKDTVLGGPRVLWNLANPIYHLVYGLAKNEDPYTKKTVVPKKYQGTQYEKNFMAEYALGQVLSPFAAFMRLKNEIELSPDLGKFGAWLIKGPLDVMRAFGVRKIDLDVMKMSEAYEKRTELSNEVKNKLAILEEAYKKANVMETTESQKYMADSFKKVTSMPGPLPSSEQIMNRLINPSVQKEIVISMIQKTKDVETRKRLVEYLDVLKKMDFIESMMKESQKVVRPFLFQGLQKGLLPTLKVPENK